MLYIWILSNKFDLKQTIRVLHSIYPKFIFEMSSVQQNICFRLVLCFKAFYNCILYCGIVSICVTSSFLYPCTPYLWGKVEPVFTLRVGPLHCLQIIDQSMGNLKLAGHNLGRVFNFRHGRAFAQSTFFVTEKRLKLSTSNF